MVMVVGQGRSIRYAVTFAGLSAATLAVGLVDPRLLGVVAWPAASWLAVACAYLGFGEHVFSKRDGRVPIVRKLLLLPNLALLYSTWHIVRTLGREPPFARVTDRLTIGRRLLATEYPGIRTVVDLTAEVDERVPEGAEYLAVPILDGAALPPDELREVARWIAACEAPVFIHCAQGHGRTAMVTSAVLLELGIAGDPDEALTVIRSVRPDAKPSRTQFEAVVAAWKRAGQRPLQRTTSGSKDS